MSKVESFNDLPELLRQLIVLKVTVSSANVKIECDGSTPATIYANLLLGVDATDRIKKIATSAVEQMREVLKQIEGATAINMIELQRQVSGEHGKKAQN